MASSRRLPANYLEFTYGNGGDPYYRTYSGVGGLTAWNGDTDVTLTAITTTDQDSSGTTLYVTSTLIFEDCELNTSSVMVDGQSLTITGVTVGISLTVSAISGTILSGTNVAAGIVLTCYDDSVTYNDSVTIDGATTSSDYSRVIRAASGQRGTRTSGVRFEILNSSTSVFPLTSYEPYFGVYDICYRGTTTDKYASMIRLMNGGHQRAIGCSVYNCSAASNSGGITINNVAGGIVANCFVTDINIKPDDLGIRCAANAASVTNYFYNNTVKSCANGTVLLTGTGYTGNLYVKNLINQNCTTPLLTTGTGTPHWYQTTNATSGVTFASDNYHLDPSDTAAINQGTDLSADSVFPFDDDIDGDPRSGAWDIGCDEYYVAPASSTYIPKMFWYM